MLINRQVFFFLFLLKIFLGLVVCFAMAAFFILYAIKSVKKKKILQLLFIIWMLKTC